MALATATRERLSWASAEQRSAWIVRGALVTALTAAAVFFYTRGNHLSFYVDEWDLMLHRRGHTLATFLDPQHGHLIAIPILIYKVLFKLFGVSSYVPYRVVAIGVELTCAALFFALVRRRVGDGIALAATLVILFLGPAWEPLISPVGVIALTSLAAGLGMLLALEVGTRRGDVLAGVLLAISLASFSYGPAFAAAAAIEILLSPGRRRRIWLVIVPSALYGLWLLGYGHSHIISSDIPGAPRAVAGSIGVDVVSITGLYRPPGVAGGPLFDTSYVAPAALAMIAIALISLRTPSRRGPRLYACITLAVLFWVEIALVLDPGRTTTSSRYVYPGVVLLLLLCAEMARGQRLGRRGLTALVIAIVALLVAVQIPDLNEGATALGNLGRFDRAELTALELARGTAAPNFMPEPLSHPGLGHHYLEHIDAVSYYAAVDAYGSPAYSIAALLRAPAGPRAGADDVLARATGIAAHAANGPPPGTYCRDLEPAATGSRGTVVNVPPGGFFLRSRQGPPLGLRLRRFGVDFGQFAVALPPLASGSAVSVPVHPDAVVVPWLLLVSGIERPAQFCALR